MNLTTIYQKDVIEEYNAVEVEYTAAVILNARNYLHTGYVDVEITSQPKLTRLCEETKRLPNTIIDGIVIALSILATIAYSLSVMRAVRLTEVFMHKIVLPLFITTTMD